MSNYELIFETEGNSGYFYDASNNLWIKKSQEKTSDNRLYLGSINPRKNRFAEVGNLSFICQQVCEGRVPGFVVRFQEGFHPVGVVCDIDNILSVKNGIIKLKERVRVSIGRKITYIYNKDINTILKERFYI